MLSDARQKAGAFKTAFHADITLLTKDGSSKSETMDRGKGTAVESSSLTIQRLVVCRPSQMGAEFFDRRFFKRLQIRQL